MDSFSELTDDLLIKILSFAPTKFAVSTSVLSKRWSSLWTMVPRLTFQDQWIDTVSEFDCIVLPSHAVSGTLLLHKSPVIETFHLTKASACSDSEVYLWVRIAIERFVRDLKISFLNEHCFIRLPSSLFRCETLETLELHQVIFLDLPSRFSLRSLKTLRLRAVMYADKESFVRLITISPVLENLVVHSCKDDNVQTFTIDVPSLRSLTVWNVLRGHEPDYKFFVVHSHSLNHLDIVDECGEVNVIGKLPELVEASLNTLATQVNALESLTFAKRLSLTLDGLDPAGSIFFQLVRLEFRGCNENWSNLLMHVLQHSPVLQILKLVVLDYGQSYWNVERGVKVRWIQPSCVPECLLFHLKTFEWVEYNGTEDEKEVAVYILKNAKRLVTATVFPDSFMMNKRQVFEELKIATRGSRTCEITMG